MSGETEENDNKTTQKNYENNSENGTSDLVYHAVYVPPKTEGHKDGTLHVYTDKKKALMVIKLLRSSRLKSFKTKSEAETYSRNGSLQENVNSESTASAPVNAEEKASSFKGPKPQELVFFRKLIESGDMDAVTKMAWENPRYLISSGDTPAILQEGCRYNALHIASFKCPKDVQMCEKILEIVSDPKFVELLYGKGDQKTYATTAKIWLDLYLNTPDKGLNETPLHFAAKYGRKEVVKLLLSYPQCLKTVKNKWDQTPIQLICTRKNQDDENLIKEIRMLLEEQYYVPVLRAEDNSLQPTIGQPFSPSSPPRLQVDPLSPKVEVKALAGPMTKPQAVEFRRKWKTPPRIPRTPNKHDHNESFTFLSPRSKDPGLRLQDTEKGLETVGRDLAEQYHVPWKEYWPFLGDFADLRCTEGLSLLENYFRKRCNSTPASSGDRAAEENKENVKQVTEEVAVESAGKNMRTSRRSKRLDTGQGVWADRAGDRKDSEKLNDEIDWLATLLEKCSLNRSNSEESDADDNYRTPPESPVPNSDDESENEYSLAEEDAFAGDNMFIDGQLPGKSDLAVINAIPEAIDAEIYPYIYRWKHEVTLATKRNNFICSTPRRRLLLTPEK